MMAGFTENNEVKRGFGANSFGGFRTGGFGFGFSEDTLEERKREKIESGGFEPVSGGFGGSVGFGFGKGPMGFSGSKGFGGSSGIGGLFGFGADQPEEEEKFPRFGGGFYDDTNAFGSFRDNNSEDESDFERFVLDIYHMSDCLSSSKVDKNLLSRFYRNKRLEFPNLQSLKKLQRLKILIFMHVSMIVWRRGRAKKGVELVYLKIHVTKEFE